MNLGEFGDAELRDEYMRRERIRHKRYQETRAAQQRAWLKAIESKAKDKARKILPGLTDSQFEALKDVIREYFDELDA